MGTLGYTTLICDSQYDAQIERRNILSVLSRAADILIIFPVSDNSINMNLLKEAKDKVILLGDCSEYPGFNCVAVDYTLGGYLAAKEMLSHGHTDLVIFGEPKTFPASQRYIEGIRRAYDEFGLTLSDDRVFFTPPSIDNGCSNFMNFWDEEKKETSDSSYRCLIFL